MTTFLSEEYPTAIYSKQFKFNYGHAVIEPLLEWVNNSDDSSEIELSAESLDDYFTLISCIVRTVGRIFKNETS